MGKEYADCDGRRYITDAFDSKIKSSVVILQSEA